MKITMTEYIFFVCYLNYLLDIFKIKKQHVYIFLEVGCRLQFLTTGLGDRSKLKQDGRNTEETKSILATINVQAPVAAITFTYGHSHLFLQYLCKQITVFLENL